MKHLKEEKNVEACLCRLGHLGRLSRLSDNLSNYLL